MIIDRRVDLFRKWIIDSNVSRHMILNESIFIHKRTINNTMTMINDDVLKIHEIDKIKIDLKNQSVIMTNVLYVLISMQICCLFQFWIKRIFQLYFIKKKLKCEKKIF